MDKVKIIVGGSRGGKTMAGARAASPDSPTVQATANEQYAALAAPVGAWECFRDEAYYGLWRVRRNNERDFNAGFHVHSGPEAGALVALLNAADANAAELAAIRAGFDPKEKLQLPREHVVIRYEMKLKNCHDCGAKPGEQHRGCCDVERCSVCGCQRIGCECEGHDRAFARWSGFWPGDLEAKAIGISLNDFYDKGLFKVFFVKPKSPNDEAEGRAQQKGDKE